MKASTVCTGLGSLFLPVKIWITSLSLRFTLIWGYTSGNSSSQAVNRTIARLSGLHAVSAACVAVAGQDPANTVLLDDNAHQAEVLAGCDHGPFPFSYVLNVPI